jgi:hypothetical protein
VPYADKYRQLKVNEAILEVLTKQYELAKVEEAKELPSVKVLDTPEIPERRSSPPRTLIIVGGTLCSLVLAGVWIVGRSRWDELDRGTPGMIFVNDVMGTIRASFPTKRSGNGSGTNGTGHPEKGRVKEADR